MEKKLKQRLAVAYTESVRAVRLKSSGQSGVLQRIYDGKEKYFCA